MFCAKALCFPVIPVNVRSDLPDLNPMEEGRKRLEGFTIAIRYTTGNDAEIEFQIVGIWVRVNGEQYFSFSVIGKRGRDKYHGHNHRGV